MALFSYICYFRSKFDNKLWISLESFASLYRRNKEMVFLKACCLGLVALLGLVQSFPTGAPDSLAVCRTMQPGHERPPISTPAPFEIVLSKSAYYNQESIQVTIRATEDIPFRGFLIQARRADPRLNQKEPIGYFQNIPGSKTVCLGNHGNGLTHTDGIPGSSQDKKEMTVTWNAPKAHQGHIHFWVTIVLTDRNSYWVAERSSVVKDPLAPPLPQDTVTYKPDTQQPLGTIDTSGCGEVKGCYRNPKGCAEPECTAVVTWVDRGSTVDFELSANTDGWVAVGFSKDKKMGEDSVVECVWNEEESKVQVRQSYNKKDMKHNIVISPTPAGLTVNGGYYSNGRVKCGFSLQKQSSGPNIFELGPRYHLLLANGKVGSDGSKERHLLEPFKYPFVSKSKVSVADVVDLDGTTRYPLVKLHGCLMILAWMMSAGTAILLARYYKPMWPNDRLCGERVWFAVHRGCQILTLICTVIGVIVIFIHTGGWSQMPDLPDKAHPILGIIVTILCILNPLLACCRCQPKHRLRPIFNWTHWLFGTVAHALSAPTLFIGLSLPKAHVPWWATWVMVAFMLFHLIIELLLEIHGCINAKKQEERSEDFEMRKKAEIRGEYYGLEQDPVGTRFKKNVLSVYLFVMIILGLVMIITVAVS